jgi:hypothetical protein
VRAKSRQNGCACADAPYCQRAAAENTKVEKEAGTAFGNRFNPR